MELGVCSDIQLFAIDLQHWEPAVFIVMSLRLATVQRIVYPINVLKVSACEALLDNWF